MTTPAVTASLQLPSVSICLKQAEARVILGLASVWASTLNRNTEIDIDFGLLLREVWASENGQSTLEVHVNGLHVQYAAGGVLAAKLGLKSITSKLSPSEQGLAPVLLLSAPANTAASVFVDLAAMEEEEVSISPSAGAEYFLSACLQVPTSERGMRNFRVATTPPILACSVQGMALNIDPALVTWIRACTQWSSMLRFRSILQQDSPYTATHVRDSWTPTASRRPDLPRILSATRDLQALGDGSQPPTAAVPPLGSAVSWRSLLLNVTIAPVVILLPTSPTPFASAPTAGRTLPGAHTTEQETVLSALLTAMQSCPRSLAPVVSFCFPAVQVRSSDVAAFVHPNVNIPVILDLENTMPWSVELNGLAVRTIMPGPGYTVAEMQQTIISCKTVDISIVEASGQDVQQTAGGSDEELSSIAAHVNCQPLLLSFTREQTTLLQSLFVQDHDDDRSTASGSTSEALEGSFLQRRPKKRTGDSARTPVAAAAALGPGRSIVASSLWRHLPCLWLQVTLPNIQFLATAEGGPGRNRQRIVAELDGLSASVDLQRETLTADLKLGDLVMNHEYQQALPDGHPPTWHPGVCGGVLAATYQAADLSKSRADRRPPRQTSWLTAKAIVQLSSLQSCPNDQVCGCKRRNKQATNNSILPCPCPALPLPCLCLCLCPSNT